MSNEPTGDRRGPAEEYSDEEAARRRDEALKRALQTPPKPHTKKDDGKGKPLSPSSE